VCKKRFKVYRKGRKMINKPRKLKVNIDVKQLAELMNLMGESVVLQLNIAGTDINEEDITEFATSDPNSDLKAKPKAKGAAGIRNGFQDLIAKNNTTTDEEEKDSCSTEPIEKRGRYKKNRAKSAAKKNEEALRRRLNIAKPSGKLDVNKAKAVKLKECGLLDSDIVEDLATLGITSLGQLIRSNAEELVAKSSGRSQDGKPVPADPMYTTVLINTIRQRLKTVGVYFRRRNYYYNT
jgi:hypothetical protein